MMVLPFIIQTGHVAKRKSGAIAGTDYVNQLNDLVQGNRPSPHAGSVVGRPLGIQTCVFKITTPVTSQGGRFNAKELYIGDSKSTLAGALAEADIGTLPSGDESILLDLGQLPSLAFGVRLGTDALGKTISAILPRGARWVQCVENGGGPGSDTTDCTWVYDIYDESDTGFVNKLNTGGAIVPKGPIPLPKVAYLSATEGIAQMDSTGAWRLFVVNETPESEDCAGGGSSPAADAMFGF